MNKERCCKCDDLTGRAGKGEDSLYTENDKGPFCEGCYPDAEITAQGEAIASLRRQLAGANERTGLAVAMALKKAAVAALYWCEAADENKIENAILSISVGDTLEKLEALEKDAEAHRLSQQAVVPAAIDAAGQTHTDHPLRHYDRTCPACNPAAPPLPTLAELSAKAGNSLMANARFMDELLSAYLSGKLREIGDGEVVVPAAIDASAGKG